MPNLNISITSVTGNAHSYLIEIRINMQINLRRSETLSERDPWVFSATCTMLGAVRNILATIQ